MESTDSTRPVFTVLGEAIQAIVDADLATETALETAYTNLINFINGVVADSTDFQETLDNLATAVATAHTNLNNALASEPLLTHKNILIEMREKINVQVNLENSNLSGIRDYTNSLTDYQSYVALAEDPDLRNLMTRISQTPEWITYFENYVENFNAINPVYITDTDSDKSFIIDKVLRDSGLPDVTDATDFEAVANKAKRDSRIDTTNFDRFTTEQIITQSCNQLGITTANRTIQSLSNTLLRNMNQHDRDEIARQLDLNESADTLS